MCKVGGVVCDSVWLHYMCEVFSAVCHCAGPTPRWLPKNSRGPKSATKCAVNGNHGDVVCEKPPVTNGLYPTLPEDERSPLLR